MSYSSYGIEKGQLIRVPATANLMIDSANRPSAIDSSGNFLATPWDFQITKPQALINGYFTRIGTTEVVLEWCYDNISPDDPLANNTFNIDVSGIALSSTTVPKGTYTVEQLLNVLKASFDAQHPTYAMTIDSADGQTVINIAGPDGPGPLNLPDSPIARLLDLQVIDVSGPTEQGLLVKCPDLRPFRYLDFTCEQLTAVQDVKDTSTATFNRDVLNRWYFSYDDPPQLDGLGFPILMGYTRFCLRRIYNPPKQIKWEQNLSLGNLRFTVYGDNGQIVPYDPDGRNNWLMTLQLSEG